MGNAMDGTVRVLITSMPRALWKENFKTGLMNLRQTSTNAQVSTQTNPLRQQWQPFQLGHQQSQHRHQAAAYHSAKQTRTLSTVWTWRQWLLLQIRRGL